MKPARRRLVDPQAAASETTSKGRLTECGLLLLMLDQCSAGKVEKASRSSAAPASMAAASPKRAESWSTTRSCWAPDAVVVGLFEDGAHQGGDHALGGFWYSRHQVAAEVDTAPLPSCTGQDG